MQFATVRQVQKFIEETDTPLLMCRAWLHCYDARTSSVERVGSNIYWSMNCERCGTAKTKVIGRDGNLVRSFYLYPDDYRAKDIGRIGADGNSAIRVALIERVS